MEDFDIPGLPVKRLVVEDDKLICFAALGNDFSLSLAVIERRDTTTINLNSQLIVLQDKNAILYFCNGDFWNLRNLEGFDVKQIAFTTSNTGFAIA